jgi:hypothetical protein
MSRRRPARYHAAKHSLMAERKLLSSSPVNRARRSLPCVPSRRPIANAAVRYASHAALNVRSSRFSRLGLRPPAARIASRLCRYSLGDLIDCNLVMTAGVKTSHRGSAGTMVNLSSKFCSCCPECCPDQIFPACVLTGNRRIHLILFGSPSWIRIEPCVSLQSPRFGAFWRKSKLGPELDAAEERGRGQVLPFKRRATVQPLGRSNSSAGTQKSSRVFPISTGLSVAARPRHLLEDHGPGTSPPTFASSRPADAPVYRAGADWDFRRILRVGPARAMPRRAPPPAAVVATRLERRREGPREHGLAGAGKTADGDEFRRRRTSVFVG